MTTDRAYRPALGVDGARAELRRGAGTQFDEAVVDAFLRVLEGSRASADYSTARAT
jgi:HD-GYP domain-containing protein (c-di-GMP phosphodiesterase class II)